MLCFKKMKHILKRCSVLCVPSTAQYIVLFYEQTAVPLPLLLSARIDKFVSRIETILLKGIVSFLNLPPASSHLLATAPIIYCSEYEKVYHLQLGSRCDEMFFMSFCRIFCTL